MNLTVYVVANVPRVLIRFYQRKKEEKKFSFSCFNGVANVLILHRSIEIYRDKNSLACHLTLHDNELELAIVALLV